MDEAVVFGAGSVGRGYMAELFTRAGYRVTFVDIDQSLVEALNSRGSYTLSLVTNESRQDVEVAPVRAILSSDTDAVADALRHATLAATAVGAEPLRQVAPLIARGIAARQADGTATPLNIIVCENLPDQAGYLRGLLDGLLGEEERLYLEDHVGLVNAVIARMVPEATAEMRARDVSGIITEPYYDLPVDGDAWHGAAPAIPGLQVVSPFAPYIVRKLYICNGLHALLGYLGSRRGHLLACDAVEDPVLRPLLEGGLREAAAGLAHAHGAVCEGCRPAALEGLISSLWPRLANRELADRCTGWPATRSASWHRGTASSDRHGWPRPRACFPRTSPGASRGRWHTTGPTTLRRSCCRAHRTRGRRGSAGASLADRRR